MDWRHRRGSIGLSTPILIGVLNVTPDSFSDGGLHLDPRRAIGRAAEMMAEGAHVIDVGGESTRPGAIGIDAATEIERVLPVIEALRSRFDFPISIDTRRAGVARAALSAGADIVNDISALGDPEMAEVVAEVGAGVILMHMRGSPESMQDDPLYGDVAAEVTEVLRGRLDYALRAGIAPECVALDPGIGFGKTYPHNLELIARLDLLAACGRPIVLGVSRKAFLGALIGGAPPASRAVATAAACVVGLLRGASIFRVHDVKVVREALQVAEAIRLAAFSPA